jgi:uncharacterized SAM-binding protein YcdF (DUF218 family)
MFYFLSKLIGYLLAPSNFVLGLGLVGIALLPTRFARVGRGLLVASVLAIAAIGVLPIGDALLLPLEDRFPRCDPASVSPDGIIVLGGVIDPWISRHRGVVALTDAAERITVPVELARQYPNAKIIFTGIKEARYAAREFQDLGVARDRVIIDRFARNTEENAAFAKRLIEPKQGEHWLLVTSAAHMPRAIGVFRKAGLPVQACPVDYQTGGPEDLSQIPASLTGRIGRTDMAVHEWLGLFAYWLTGRTSTLLPGPGQ